MATLKNALRSLQIHSKEGSYTTQANRRKILDQASVELKELGFRKMTPRSLKPKHVIALVNSWKQRELAPGTMKNRMASIRWWAEKVGKLSCIPSNTELGIDKRNLVKPNDVNLAKTLEADKLDKVKLDYVKQALRLQEEFGLRREEALKFQPRFAIRGDTIHLKNSWTKGGKAREIPIVKESQRALLSDFKHFRQGQSMIPSHLSYAQAVKAYENSCNTAGLDRNHGLRYRYAQERYKEITSNLSPRCGGKSRSDMTKQEITIDNAARYIISKELGHERLSITNVYLGS